MKVRDLSKQKEMSGDQAHNLVKDMLSKSLSKSGKVKALKLKVKFGGGEKSKHKKHKVSGPTGQY
jgi:hypothetical protein